MSASDQLKEKLRAVESGMTDQDGKPVKSVTFSSDDFAGAPAPATAEGAEQGPVSGPVKAFVPKAANADVMLATGGSASKLGNSIAEQGTAASSAGSDIANSESLFTTEEITIEDKDREAFISSLLTGDRFIRQFSLFGGAVSGKLRCRSAKESEAIAAWVNKGIKDGRYASTLEYSVGVRNALLAAQVMELNGVAYAELETPLLATSSKGVVTEPGWLASADAWSDKPEPLVAGVYDELRLFEKMYWTLVAHASDQNFWHPVEST